MLINLSACKLYNCLGVFFHIFLYFMWLQVVYGVRLKFVPLSATDQRLKDGPTWHFSASSMQLNYETLKSLVYL